MTPYLQSIILAFLSGLIPALIWLFFWLREDELHPEPKKIILLCFFSGMLVVPIVLPIQKYVNNIFVSTTLLFILWAFIEEFLKFVAAYVTGLSRKCDDEPVDNIIYLISVALGFAALENTLFLIDSISSGQITTSLITGSMRFVGSTLLHVVSSATVGIFVAFAFYHSRKYKIIFTLLGLVFATVVHTMFNLLIINTSGPSIFLAFGFVWSMVVFVLLFFEKVKKIKGPDVMKILK